MGWGLLQWEHWESIDPARKSIAFIGGGNAGPVTVEWDNEEAVITASFDWGADYASLVGSTDVFGGGYTADSWDFMESWWDTYIDTTPNTERIAGAVTRDPHIGEGAVALGASITGMEVDGDLEPWIVAPNTNALLTAAPGSGTAAWTVNLDALADLGRRAVWFTVGHGFGEAIVSLVRRDSGSWISKTKSRPRRRDDDD